MPADGISLIIPAYNEADRIVPTLRSYVQALKLAGLPFEVIVVIDGADATEAAAAQFAHDGVRSLVYSRKLGRGGAIFKGLREARYNVVAYADADGSVGASEFMRLLEVSLSGAPAVIASRRAQPDLVIVPEPLLKRIAGTAWVALVHACLGLRVADAQCGLKIFSADVIRIILRTVRVTNRTFEVDMLYHVSAAGIPIVEMPVSYVHDFRTRMPLLGAIPIMFVTLIGIALVNRSPLRQVLPMSAMKKLNGMLESV